MATVAEAVRAWLSLSWLGKAALAKHLDLWTAGDANLSDEALDLAVLTRARDRGLLDKLAQEACQNARESQR